MNSASEGGGRASGLPALLPGVRSFWASTKGRNKDTDSRNHTEEKWEQEYPMGKAAGNTH